MKYLFLAYEDALLTSERDVMENACRVNDEALRTSGHLLAAEGVEGNNSAVTVRVHDGALDIADGSCTNANEQLTWLFFINASDLNEASHVASKMPQVRGGPIEVRPIMLSDAHQSTSP